MTSKEYISLVNNQVQSLFNESLNKNEEVLNAGLNLSKSLQTFNNVIEQSFYNKLLQNSIEALEFSLLSQTYCFYRNAFSSLRLSLEMLFGAIYFSARKIDYIEWENNKNDLHWSTINDFENGILSHKFCGAFFPEIKSEAQDIHTKSKELYRNLSEYVHGNYSTWQISDGISLNDNAVAKFYDNIKLFEEVALFALSLRFAKELDKSQISKIESIMIESLSHITHFQNFLSTQI